MSPYYLIPVVLSVLGLWWLLHLAMRSYTRSIDERDNDHRTDR